MKIINFTEDSNNGIKNEIETDFPYLRGQEWVFFCCNSTSDLKVATTPVNGWNLKELKKYL
jgi:hypothetical protein